MSEGADKSELPTAGKIQKAREEGQIARSKDLTSLSPTISFLIFLITAPLLLTDVIKEVFNYSFTLASGVKADFDYTGILTILAVGFIKAFGILLIIKLIVTPLLNGMIGGFTFNTKLIKPKFSKINPLEGFKRIFSKNTIVEFFKSVVKIGAIFTLFISNIVMALSEFSTLSRASIINAFAYIEDFFLIYYTQILAFLFIFSAADILYQLHDHKKKLMMSKQDIKDEHKENEGRPEVKQRIRQVQMQMAKKSINRTVPTADFVLTNPSHYSVAIKYDPEKAEAPYVVAKGKDEIALHIRRVAADNSVQCIPLPPLARSIYYTTNIEQMVPNQLYQAIAEVLSYIRLLEAYKREERKDKPLAPTNFTIPEELSF
ncbi:flagellar biosynthesis protein FlhB [Vibrio barjaei]|uniref:EscU/YscU/HrcU family type III secretion system export apparatus switch protein n=1 Tax=Vibrio barjaei TaxID=1676683 RepID=UPI0022842792|nr:flagellar type III secretion system protein FlhB [Vibrio barjaei]MCY9872326.1 flagellar type III secretion system protein FlhB [Vibrio barjaei]